jgi:hypothetical protein
MAERKRTDPELLRQLDVAKETGRPVAAVLKIKRQRGVKTDVARIEARTQRAIDRVAEATGERPDDVNVMGAIGVVYVTGPERFLRELVDQPEVDGAVANESSGTTSDA